MSHVHFKCYYFPSFDLSFAFVKGAFIFGGVRAVRGGALEPASLHVSDANSQPGQFPLTASPLRLPGQFRSPCCDVLFAHMHR